MKLKRKYLGTGNIYIIIYFHICFISILASLGYLIIQKDAHNWQLINYISSVVSLFIFIWCLYSWKCLTERLFSPYVLLLCSFFIFMNGQSFLNIFSLNDEKFVFDTQEMFAVQLFTFLCLTFFHLGALITLLKKRSNKITIDNPNFLNIKEREYRALQWLGVLFTCISFIPALWMQYEIIKVFFVYGYGYEGTHNTDLYNFPGIITRLESFFIPGIFCLLIGFKNKRHIRDIALFILVAVSLSDLLVGDRSGGMGLIVATLWLWNTGIKNVEFEKVRKIFVFLFLAIITMFIVSSLRNLEEFSLLGIIETLSGSFTQSNPLIDQLNEMGWSVYPLILTMQLVPEAFSFSLGASYFDAILSIVPATVRNLMGLDIEVSLASWLMDVKGMVVGPGYSLAAEAYYNFGWFGTIFMILLGFFFAKMVGYISNYSLKSSPIKMVIIAIVLFLSITVMRRSMGTIISPLFYNAFIPYILAVMISRVKR